MISLNIPTLTAFGNDYPFPDQLKRILEQRGFGNQDVLIGIQTGDNDRLLTEALKYNHRQEGTNVIISNTGKNLSMADYPICIETDNPLIMGDLVQIILHFLTANLAYKADPTFHDKGAGSFIDYCSLLMESLSGPYFASYDLAELILTIKAKLISDNRIFVFGNGGSAALASFFVDGLREDLVLRTIAYDKIFDITSFKNNITKSINRGYYKNDVLTEIIRGLGVKKGDLLLGISSSGNSENIVHPFLNLKDTIRIGILGFEDGGTIGRMSQKDMAVIFPDAGGFKSYQRAEDGQRIVISTILNSLNVFDE